VALLRSVPRIDAAEGRLLSIPGQPPTPTMLPSGCVFHPRCAIGRGRQRCASDDPLLVAAGGSQHAACHFVDEAATLPAPPGPRIPAAARAPVAHPEPPLLKVEGLRVYFPIRSRLLRRRIGSLRAVDGADLTVHAGETVGLVGESGCGKTTTGRAIMGLIRAAGGSICFDGKEITRLPLGELRRLRRNMQYVFQDPHSSLNPVLTVGEIIAEPLRIHGLYESAGGAARIAELLELSGLSRTTLGRYPREFSGGQRQRIGLARALALAPRLLILDEPVAALDVSIQAQIINLLQDLQRELGLAYLFIAHDLAVVRRISDRVAVMYLGRIVEESTRATLYEQPMHPYTQSLMSAVPVPDPRTRDNRRRIVLEGDVPNPAAPPPGCTFHPRCFRASDRCRVEAPAFTAYPGLPTWTACHHAGPLDAAREVTAACGATAA
jgi:peptide/nickel transport system ATP-binding protein